MWIVPGLVSNISWRQLNQTIIIIYWDVSALKLCVYKYYRLLQPPSSPTHPPVLYYTVTHNVSGNGSELAFNTTTNEAILRYEVTHSILICAINSVGKGPITVFTFFIGKIKIIKICYYWFLHRVRLL